MSKSAEAFRTISEVSDALDTPAHVLRFWESRFSQIKPVKRAGGRRYYRPADVALLGGIKRLLHDEGLTIRGVQKLLRERGVKHVAAVGGLAPAEMEAELAGLPTDEPDAYLSDQVTAPDYDGSDDEDALAAASDVWPEAPDPLPAAADAGLARDPDDAIPNDLFGSAPPRNTTPWDIIGGPRAKRTPGETARADLQRGREAAGKLANEPDPGKYREIAPAVDAPIPAAAMLRAMTAIRAGERRVELRAIYERLAELHKRRLDEGDGGHP